MKLEKEQKKKAGIALRCFYVVLVLLPLLFVATYTWFSMSRTPKVSEMGMSVDSGTGLELAFEAESEEWTQYLDFREKNIEMAPLKPVTWSERAQSFYAAEFGMDGRIAGITQQLSDGGNTNTRSSNSYYMKNTCYARTGAAVTVSLSPAVVSGDGTQGAGTYVIGTPVWDTNTVLHNNGGNGAENAVRVGIRITKYNKENTMSPIEDSIFYIYEPNCDSHLDGTNIDVATASIDGSATLVPEERLIRQTTSQWSEANPVQRDVVIRDLGDFTTDTELFELEPEQIAKIDFYVWLEGQDVDCTNQIGSDAQIFVNIQFASDANAQSGMEEIK